MAGLLDVLGLGGVANGLLGGEDQREKLQGILLALGGNEALGINIMNNAGSRDAGNIIGSIFGGPPQAAATPAAPQAAPSSYADRTVNVESRGIPTAKNPNSSAYGPGQFINSTWMDTIAKHRPDLANLPREQLLAMRSDPALSKDMTAKYGDDNAAMLQSRGLPVSDGTKYLAHFLGPQGAAAVLSANPQTPVAQLVSPQAVAANRSILEGKTAGQVVAWADSKMGGSAAPSNSTQVPIGTTAGQPQTNGDALPSGMMPTAGPTPQQMAQPQAPDINAQIQAALRHKNPKVSAYGADLLKKQAELQIQNQYKSTDDIREYEYAKARGFGGSLEEWVQRKRSGAGEYGLQPIWGTDPKTGKPAIIQLGKGGQAIQTQIPNGIEVGKDALKVDAGTHTVLLDPVTRQPIGTIPKNIEQKEAAEERGKAIGQAQVGLSNVESQSQQALNNIKQIREHPGKKSLFGVGVLGGVPAIPGTDQGGFVALVDQLKGKTFLEAFNMLKGGGAITEIEGTKAERAIARLQRTQKETDFDAALRDLEQVIQAGMVRARQRAGGITPPAGTPGPDLPTPSNDGWRSIGYGARIREKP